MLDFRFSNLLNSKSISDHKLVRSYTAYPLTFSPCPLTTAHLYRWPSNLCTLPGRIFWKSHTLYNCESKTSFCFRTSCIFLIKRCCFRFILIVGRSSILTSLVYIFASPLAFDPYIRSIVPQLWASNHGLFERLKFLGWWHLRGAWG